MREGEPQPEISQEGGPEQLDMRDLSFDQLREARGLAKTSFRETEKGFENVNGDGVFIRQSGGGVYRLSEISHELKDFHGWMVSNSTSVLARGSTDKAEMISAIRDVLKHYGNRIIE